MNTIDEISLSTCIFAPHEKSTGAEYGEYVSTVQAAGIKYIELSRKTWGNDDREFERIEKSGIKVWSIHGILDFRAISPDPAERAAAIETAYVHAARAARFAPCPLVEHYMNRYSDPEKGKLFRESIWAFYEKVSALGYTLCIETAPYKPKQFDHHPDSREISDFVRSFGREDLQIIIDVNHSNLYEDLTDTARNCRGLIKNVHISNNHGTWEDHLPPLEGVIDMKRTFDALRANGYTGPCNLEFRFQDDRPITAQMLQEVRKSMEKLLWNRG